LNRLQLKDLMYPVELKRAFESAGASPAASTTESKPQETGTGLLIRFGEVAATSDSTSSWM
jgi:hypothetical protein